MGVYWANFASHRHVAATNFEAEGEGVSLWVTRPKSTQCSVAAGTVIAGKDCLQGTRRRWRCDRLGDGAGHRAASAATVKR